MAMIHVYGIGPGDPQLILTDFTKVCEEADMAIGSHRQLEMLPTTYQGEKINLPKLSELIVILKEALHKNQTVLLLASGDPLFFGIGTFILNNFPDEFVKIHPGISSVQYLFTQVGLSMNDTFITSSHGRQPNFDKIVQESSVGMVTDEENGPYEIAQALIQRGVTKCQFYIGENLSYSNEKISVYDIEEVPQRKYDMNVVIIKNEG